MMGSEDALPSTMNPDGAREDGGKSQLESMEMEIALLRSSEASLIAELQRRCDKAIELEVQLDQERARANRLEREKTEEDEALSGELREIMATVAGSSAASTTSVEPSPEDSTSSDAALRKAEEDKDRSSDSAVAAKEGQGKEGSDATAEEARAEQQDTPGEQLPPASGGGGGSGGSGFFTDQWRKIINSGGGDDGGDGKDGEKTAGGGAGSTGPALEPAAAAAAAAEDQGNGKGETDATAEGPAGQETLGGSGGSGFFAEWRLRRAQKQENSGAGGGGGGGKNGDDTSVGCRDNNGKGGEEQGGGRGVVEKGNNIGGDGPRGLPPKGRNGREQAAGALRARVVELELLRAEADDLMKEKTDRSIRLEVQVEQLKNIVQSLSHASVHDEAQEWGDKKKLSRMISTNQGKVDLDPLLRGVPGVDPSVLLQLHRTPWADGVIDGIREEVACFEWQGRDSRRDWSSKLGTLPTELSSLPYHPAGPGPPLPPSSPPQPPPSSSSSSSSSSLPQRSTNPPSPRPNVASKGSPPRSRSPLSQVLGSGEVEPTKEGEQQAGGAGAGAAAATSVLREKIGGAVAAWGLGGGGGEAPGGRMITDEAVTLYFGLDDVALPSDHWEWVGGWVVDSEMEASADEDGWIYGNSPSEIAEIALGGTSFTSSSVQKSSSVSSVNDAAAGTGTKGGGSGTSTASPRTNGVEVESQQQQQQQPDTPVSGSVSTERSVSPGPSADDESIRDAEEDQQRQEKDGVEGGVAGAVTVREGGGSETDAAPGAGAGAGARAGAGVGDSGDSGGEVTSRLRRRRLVRLRMVARVDGARESTSGVVALFRRICGLEILVRKLSGQVVHQQRQVTGLESQVAYLASLYPRLRKACALGRKDRLRGNVLQEKLVEAENEIKVLRRCMGAAKVRRSVPPPPRSPPASGAAASHADADVDIDAGTPSGQAAKATTAADDDGLSAEEKDGDGRTGSRAGLREGGSAAGKEAWGWVEGVAQRAAETLARRSRPPPPPTPTPTPLPEGSGEGSVEHS